MIQFACAVGNYLTRTIVIQKQSLYCLYCNYYLNPLFSLSKPKLQIDRSFGIDYEEHFEQQNNNRKSVITAVLTL